MMFAQDKPQAVAAESPSNTPEPSLAEKIRDAAPNKKSAMRISYDAKKNQELISVEKADAKTIFPQAIKAIGDSGATYTGKVRFTLAFDPQHHASVKNVGKTKTEVSD